MARPSSSRRRGGAARIALTVVLGLLAVLVLGWLALRRPDIPYATLQAKFGAPADHYLDLPGGLHVRYRDEGRRDGPPIVLVHGFSASLADWEPWVRRLGGEYRVVSLDLPGHGLTRAPAGYGASTDGYADLVVTLAERLGLGRYVLAGNSMGGGVAWDVALRHPTALSALVLVDAAGWLERHASDSGPLIFKLMRNPVGRFLIKDLDNRRLAEQGLKDAFLDPRLVTPALVDRYVSFARAPGHRDILLSIGRREVASPAAFAAIHVPTLVMHGRQDRLVPFADGQGFAGAIPGARLIAYDGVGHVPMEQIADRSAEDLRGFLHAHGIGGAAPVAPAPIDLTPSR